MQINEVSGIIVDSAIRVHSALGPGLLESAYETCLLHELRKRGLKVEPQVPLPVIYDGVKLDWWLQTRPAGRRRSHCGAKGRRDYPAGAQGTTAVVSAAKWQAAWAFDQLLRASP